MLWVFYLAQRANIFVDNIGLGVASGPLGRYLPSESNMILKSFEIIAHTYCNLLILNLFCTIKPTIPYPVYV